jgi:Integrase core domain
MPIESLSDNGSPDTARETRALAREIGLVPCTRPIESPQSNGMAEAFVKTLKKRDYTGRRPCPDAASVLRQLDGWFEHDNPVHQHKALGYRSPREFRKQTVEGATENAVGARPHLGTTHEEPSPVRLFRGDYTLCIQGPARRASRGVTWFPLVRYSRTRTAITGPPRAKRCSRGESAIPDSGDAP